MTLRSLSPIVLGLALVACSPGGQAGEQTSAPAIDPDDPAPPSVAQARTLIDDWLADHPACAPFFAMPWDVAVDSQVERRRAQAFVDAGVLRAAGQSSFPGAVEPRPALRYLPSAQGEQYFRPGGEAFPGVKTLICYGTVKLADVSISDADPMLGRATARYRFRIADIPDWTRAPGIVALYPWLEGRLAEDGEADAALVLRDGAWRLDRPTPPAAFDLRQLGH